MIRNRVIQPKDKYQVWWFPTQWPHEVKPHWELRGAYEFASEAYAAVIKIRNLDPQAEVATTKAVKLDVIEGDY